MEAQHGPARHPAIETALFGDEAVLYDDRSEMVHHLNASACAIWMLLDGRPVHEVVATLSRATASAPAEIRRDVLQTIAELRAACLVTD